MLLTGPRLFTAVGGGDRLTECPLQDGDRRLRASLTQLRLGPAPEDPHIRLRTLTGSLQQVPADLFTTAQLLGNATVHQRASRSREPGNPLCAIGLVDKASRQRANDHPVALESLDAGANQPDALLVDASYDIKMCPLAEKRHNSLDLHRTVERQVTACRSRVCRFRRGRHHDK